MYQKVMAGQFEFIDDVVIISYDAKDLIRRLLDPNPVTRLSITVAMNHAWLHDNILSESKSYLNNYDNFLVEHGFNLMPISVD